MRRGETERERRGRTEDDGKRKKVKSVFPGLTESSL